MGTETVHFTTFDEVILTGDLRRADSSRTNSPCPASFAVCHPHPLYGGDRRNNVVVALCDAIHRANCPALAFDFRGAGESGGDHDGHGAERIDVLAAVEFMSTIEPELPVVLAGYSFGAATALNVVDERVACWVAIAPPVSMLSPTPIAAMSHRPKYLATPEHDQFTSVRDITTAVATWENTSLEIVTGADHFMVGRFVNDASLLDELVRRAIASTL